MHKKCSNQNVKMKAIKCSKCSLYFKQLVKQIVQKNITGMVFRVKFFWILGTIKREGGQNAEFQRDY
jgi:hypothetical protein